MSAEEENFWHSDVTWRAQPSLGSILRAIELPEVGGDNLFANMETAYERLDDETKAQIESLVADHDIARVFADRMNTDADALRAKYPPAEHPILRTHPETGKRSLYVNTAFTSHIKDMDPDESKASGIQRYSVVSAGSQGPLLFGTTGPTNTSLSLTIFLR